MQKYSKMDLTTFDDGVIVNAGPNKPLFISGSRAVTGGDFQCSIFADALYFADLRELFRETGTGTTYDVFITPYQARFFCAPNKGANESENRNDQIIRRSPCHTHTLCKGAARRRFVHPENAPVIHLVHNLINTENVV